EEHPRDQAGTPQAGGEGEGPGGGRRAADGARRPPGPGPAARVAKATDARPPVTAAATAAAAPAPPTRAYVWYALGLLTFINLLSYLDRNVIFALFEPIKAELALSDAQLGWLGSAYVLVFSLAALPFGVMSDLRSRRAVIAFGVACWSLFTVLSGMVDSYAQL